MNEFDYINKYIKPLTGNIGRNLKDDAAVFMCSFSLQFHGLRR